MSYFDKIPHEELIAISSRAGVNSGITRRAKREMIERIKLEHIAEQELFKQKQLMIHLQIKDLIDDAETLVKISKSKP